MILRNITLSADKTLIERARMRAKMQNTTLNAEFRRWLLQYAEVPQNKTDFNALIEHFRYAQPGKTFSRGELNEH
jgi:hypothetical protein